ncbi:hypothetical protein DL770_001064 [Monosporascus sp. CRB-9-2]|nr:hypothetical protein DL770_001064 [Monosporascus sp. CRB-9-2]
MEQSDEADIQKYTYAPLAIGFFRLFRLVGGRSAPGWSVDVGPVAKTAAPDVTTPLRVECVESPFEDPICYEALSYSWGGHERSLSPEERDQYSQLDRKIFVSDGDEVVGFLLISASLEAALRHLIRQTDKPLFVDQICINQADNDEKGRLVRRMGEIYSKAKRVLAWLGPSTPEAEKFVSFMKNLEKDPPGAFLRLADHDYPILDVIRLSVVAPNPESKPVPDHLKPDRDMLREMAIKMWDEIPLRGFVDVCSRQYFGRMWIVQEACLPENPQFVCGHSVWHADHFERTSLLFSMSLGHRAGNLTPEDVNRDYPKVDDIILAIALGRFVNRLFGTRRTIHRPGQTRMPLFHILTKFNVADTATSLTERHDLQKFRARDPRDCYYSLLALPEATDTAVKRVVVSYKKSPQQVFSELAVAILEDYTDVLLFSQNARKRLKGLPSWVPDWSSNLAGSFGYLQSDKPLFTAGSAKGSQNWEGASGPRVEGPMLAVAGYSVGAIDRIGEYVYKMMASEKDEPTEVSHHYFLSEIELFCHLAREAQAKSAASPPRLEDAPWLMASGGRGLADNLNASYDERVGPEIQGVRLLDAAYQIWRQYFERHTKKRELVCWQNRRSEILRPREKRWAELKKRTGLYWGLMYWLGIGEDWEDYEFCEKFNRHWDKFGPMAEAGADDRPDGWSLAPDVRDEGLRISSRLGSAMDVHQGRRCFVTPEGYLGLGPLEMQVGDVVVILKGASVPMVLRSDDSGPEGQEQFKYVGEAYCYGSMDGELLERRAGEAPSVFRLV